MGWKTLLESISESLNDHLRLRNDYLMAENRILRNQIDGRVQLTDAERKELAELGAKLGKKALAEIATIAQPDTILAWNCQFANPQVDTSKPPRPVGRPCVDKEVEDLVIRMARENRSWGYDRIQGALNHLGYTISDQTVGNILKRNGIPPAPKRKETVTWREFVRIHLDVLGATDFFNSNVWNWFGFLITSLFGFLDTGRRQVHAVQRFLHQRIQGIDSSLLHVLNVHIHHKRGGYWNGTVARLWSTHFREDLPFDTLIEFSPHAKRHLQTRHMGNVVRLSMVCSRQIRDGPIQHQHRDYKFLGDKCRKAA